MKILTCKQMRTLEELSEAHGVDRFRLMENAGSAAARLIGQQTGFHGKKVVIICGKGNNGGDGFVVARKLCGQADDVCVALLQGTPNTKHAYMMYERIVGTDVKILNADFDMGLIGSKLGRADIIIDAVFGTGFTGCFNEKLADIFSLINRCRGIKVALDIPSGIDADTGQACEYAFHADYTVTFGAYKQGQLLSPANEYCGKILMADIAIPQSAYDQVEYISKIITLSDIQQWLPPRPENCNKGDFGKVLAVCGCNHMSGAAVLAVQGAQRCGAGLVTLATVASVANSLTGRLIENTFLPLAATSDGFISSQNISCICKAMRSATAVLIGCGMGVCDDTRALLRAVVENANIPVIIDADGINILAANIDILQAASAPVILTPHPGEMARLCKKSIEYIQANRYLVAKEFAQQHQLTLVLKGANTVIASPQGEVYFNQTGNPGLAKGGSGDLLAGMLAAFLAQGIEPSCAAAMAVYLHGKAADICVKKFSQTAMLATDVLNTLPELFCQIGR